MHLTSNRIDRFQEKFNDYLAPYLEIMDKPRQKVLPEMIEGMLSSGSTLVAQSARRIDPEHLETTERRFLRTLQTPHWDESDLWVVHLKQAAKEIQANTMVTVDITDLAKPHAQKMEALATVRDGSKKTLTKGYWMLGMNAALPKGRILPIVHEVFSQESDEFKSQNDILFFWFECLFKVTSKKGLYVLDRGGDSQRILDFFLDRQAQFLIRLNTSRLLLSGGIPVSFNQIPSKLPFGLRKILKRHHSNVTFDWLAVTLPHRTERLTLVVIRSARDRNPILLLTNQAVRYRQEAALLVDAYFKRWKIEESFRFLKQEFRLEKFLIRNFRAIQRFFFLLCIAWGFLTRFVRFKWAKKLLETFSFSFAKKKIGFFYYQWFRGLQFVFTLCHTLRFLEVV